MNVLFLTLGNEWVPSSRTRVFQYLPHFHRLGIDTRIIKYKTGLDYLLWAKIDKSVMGFLHIFRLLAYAVEFFDRIFSFIQTLKFLVVAPYADIVFIQKVVLPLWAQRILFRKNKRLVYDYDDAIYLSTARHQLAQLTHQISHMQLAVVENDATEKYARNQQIPTLRVTGPIDCERYRPKAKSDKKEIIVGWIGSSGTINYLNLIHSALRTISERHGNVIVELIGSGSYPFKGVRSRNHSWSLATEVALLERFDIGIMPLPNDEFSQGKGGYKLLQYMAMGLPSVASPVGINKTIIVNGETGFLVNSEEEWIIALEKLIIDSTLRERVGACARKRAINTYSFEKNTPILIEQLRQVATSNT